MRWKRSPVSKQRGFTYVEALAALLLTAILLVGLTRTVSTVLAAHDTARATHNTLEESRYALERMVRAVSASGRLMVPQAENPGTPHFESIRDPGVLAMTLDPTRDLDGDGVVDADNDGDGRVDEDPGSDAGFDLAPGIWGIDDDNDGLIDYFDTLSSSDDDESGGVDDDRFDGVDNDGDGAIDEDPEADANFDGEPGLAGVDDDGDGTIDEGSPPDDDEDGTNDEDWWDVVVFYQVGTNIIERTPVPWDESGGGIVSGMDYVERTLATDVSQFRVERVPAPNGGPPLISLLLTRTDAEGVPNTLSTTVRAGGGP